MFTTEANIVLTRSAEKLTSVSVSMPVWTNKSDFDDNLIVRLPLLSIETIAKDDLDAETAIREAIISFCLAAEKFGQGVEKELQSLGWNETDDNGNPVLGFCVSETDELLERLLKTGDNYVNTEIAITEDLAHA